MWAHMGACHGKKAMYDRLQWLPCPKRFGEAFNDGDLPLEMVVNTSSQHDGAVIRFREEVTYEGAPKTYLYQRFGCGLEHCNDYYTVREFPERVHFLISEPMSRLGHKFQFVASMFVEGQERYVFDGVVSTEGTIRTLVGHCLQQARLPSKGVEATIKFQSEKRSVNPRRWHGLIAPRVQYVIKAMKDFPLPRNDINAGIVLVPFLGSDVDAPSECEEEPTSVSTCGNIHRSRSRSRWIAFCCTNGAVSTRTKPKQERACMHSSIFGMSILHMTLKVLIGLNWMTSWKTWHQTWQLMMPVMYKHLRRDVGVPPRCQLLHVSSSGWCAPLNGLAKVSRSTGRTSSYDRNLQCRRCLSRTATATSAD